MIDLTFMSPKDESSLTSVFRCFREEAKDDGGSVDTRIRAEDRLAGGSGARLVCRFCGALITSRGDAVEVEGRHEHTFFNPAGILFEIGCFGFAPGCQVSGLPTDQFAWFQGYLWQFSSCAVCGAHLGWYFSGGANASFHGLITNRLVEEEENSEGQ